MSSVVDTTLTADDDWVSRALVETGHQFSFFQAVRLMEALHADGMDTRTSAAIGKARIAFRPHHGLAFPPADVRGAERMPEGGLRLVLNFWGFYGVDSPLPAYFGTTAASAEPEAAALRDFLDIFGHRLYALLYGSWKKYRPSLGAAGSDAKLEAKFGSADTNMRRYLCLAALGAPSSPGVVDVIRLLPFASILRTPVRNADGLLDLLRAFVPNVASAIEENVPRWVPITPRPLLGSRSRQPSVLGETAIAGARLLDESGKFRLVLGPLTWTQFQQLHPGEVPARVVAELVQLYAPDFLAYDVELLLSTTELPVTRIGSPSNRLGLTTWLGHPRHAVISEIVTYA